MSALGRKRTFADVLYRLKADVASAAGKRSGWARGWASRRAARRLEKKYQLYRVRSHFGYAAI